MAKTPEGKVQKYGREELTKRGCLVRKISYEGRRGCPDYLVFAPRPELTVGRMGVVERVHDVLFIEYKRDEATEPEPHQLREHARMRAVGADVRVIGSKAQVDALIEELFPCAS